MAFFIPPVKECCCGCNLKTGTLIIGSIQLVGALLLLLSVLGLIGIGVLAYKGLEEDVHQRMMEQMTTSEMLNNVTLISTVIAFDFYFKIVVTNYWKQLKANDNGEYFHGELLKN